MFLKNGFILPLNILPRRYSFSGEKLSGYNNSVMMLTVHSVFFGQHLYDHTRGLNVFLKSLGLFVQDFLAVFSSSISASNTTGV